jgi:deoxyribose-phosphate aldolase
LIKAVVGDKVGIKAAGGIRNREQAERMIAAGATRLGTSAGPEFVKQAI